MEDHQVHHVQPRGRLSDDSAEKLIALCVKCHQDVRAGQYWRVSNVRSFDEFLERKFPESSKRHPKTV